MQMISESQLQDRLDSGSKKRLSRFRLDLRRDSDRVIFDDRVLKILQEYVWDKPNLEKVRDYLNEVEDDKGFSFSQSRKEYAQLQTAIELFSQPDHTSFRWNRNYQKAVQDLVDYFSQFHLDPVVYRCDSDIVNTLPKTDTHSGFQYIITGKKSKGEHLEDILRKYSERETQARQEGTFDVAILPGTRTQGSGAFEDDGSFTGKCKHKTRLVSMVDLFLILAECQYAVPFQELLGLQPFYAGGKDDAGISRVITSLRGRYYRYISIDYSHFDQSISSWLIEDAFRVVRAAFDSVDDQLFGIIINDFINKNFVTADGVTFSSKGVPSGSMFTQIIDSIVNIIMIKTYFNSIGNKVEMIVMGDDNLMYFNGDVEVASLCSYLVKNFGVLANVDKTSSGLHSDAPGFLSREWRGSGQWRHPNVLISKLLFPERFRVYTHSAKPELVIYSYILAYEIGMRKLMDVDRFLREHRLVRRKMTKEEARYLSGYLRYALEYGLVS